MPKQAELAKAIKAVWDASADLLTSVPGGLEYGRVRQGADTPYASLRIRADVSEFTSDDDGGGTIQDYLATLRVWSGQDIADVSSIETDVGAALDGATLSVTGATFLGIWGDPGSLDEDPETRQAKDVLLTEFNWRIKLQE